MVNNNDTNVNFLHSSQCNFSWSAIFGGTVTAAAIGALFSLIGIAIGLALFKPDADMVLNISIAGIIWFVIGGTIAMFAGGLVTGYLAPATHVKKAKLYGLVMWSFFFMINLVLTTTSAGALLSGAGQLVGKTLSISTQAAASAVGPLAQQTMENLNLGENKPLKDMAEQVKEMVNKTAKKAGDEASASKVKELVEAIKNFVTNSDEQDDQELRDKAVKAISENSDLSRNEANQLLDKWQEAYQEAADKAQEKADELKEQAKEAANYSSNVLSAITLYASIAMIFGAIATIWGSAVGMRANKA